MSFKKHGKYRCFSPNQFQYLVGLGFLPVGTKKHIETGRTYWEFRHSQLLSIALTKWSSRTRDV